MTTDPNEEPTVVTPAASPAPTPAPVAVTPAAGAEAEVFLQQELTYARKSLQLTRIVSVLLSVGVIGYLGYVTHHFQDSLSPRNAAEIAHGLIAERVDEQAPQIAETVKARVPALIAQIPDYALQQIPQFRQRTEDQIIGDLTGYANSSSATLGTHLDDFLTAHKDEVGQMIDDGQDPALVSKVGADLQSQFVAYLKEKPAGSNESYQSKLDQSLEILTDTKAKMDRLANGKNLTPDELKARHAVAVLTTGIDQQGKALLPQVRTP